MTDKPVNWMDQAGDLYKQWTDQQQNLFRSMAGGAGLFGLTWPDLLRAEATARGPRKAKQAIFIFLALLLWIIWALWALKPRPVNPHAAA